jgi:hypothetical protein
VTDVLTAALRRLVAGTRDGGIKAKGKI